MVLTLSTYENIKKHLYPTLLILLISGYYTLFKKVYTCYNSGRYLISEKINNKERRGQQCPRH